MLSRKESDMFRLRGRGGSEEEWSRFSGTSDQTNLEINLQSIFLSSKVFFQFQTTFVDNRPNDRLILPNDGADQESKNRAFILIFIKKYVSKNLT